MKTKARTLEKVVKFIEYFNGIGKTFDRRSMIRLR
jgi:hypothetical protein